MLPKVTRIYPGDFVVKSDGMGYWHEESVVSGFQIELPLERGGTKEVVWIPDGLLLLATNRRMVDGV